MRIILIIITILLGFSLRFNYEFYKTKTEIDHFKEDLCKKEELKCNYKIQNITKNMIPKPQFYGM